MHQIVWTKDFETRKESRGVIGNLFGSLFRPTLRQPVKPVSLKQWIMQS